jgi:hypothetical protein
LAFEKPLAFEYEFVIKKYNMYFSIIWKRQSLTRKRQNLTH